MYKLYGIIFRKSVIMIAKSKIRFFKILFLFCLISVFLIGINACSKKMSTISSTPVAPGTKSYLALGDSYTIGQSVDPSQRFPALTVALLKSYGIAINDADIIATTGWTTGDLLNAISSASLRTDYSLVTLLIGVNNQYQGKSLEEYKNQFSILVQDAIKYAGNDKNRVFVLSIPDYSVTPYAKGSDTERIASEINLFNAANLSISNSYGVHYIDITSISREAKNKPELIAGDGLHPSGIQYQRWADLLAPAAKSVLK